MFLRLVFCSLFSLALGAQRNTVNFEIHAMGFPKDRSFQIEGKLKYFAIDAKKNVSEAGSAPAIKDYLIERESTNKYSWNISLDENGSAIIEGSPQSVTFEFPKRIYKMSNADNFIAFEGKVTHVIHGTGVDIPLRRASFKSGATYVLLLKNETLPNGVHATRVSFINKEDMQKTLEAKPPDMDIDALRSNPGIKVIENRTIIDKTIIK